MPNIAAKLARLRAERGEKANVACNEGKEDECQYQRGVAQGIQIAEEKLQGCFVLDHDELQEVQRAFHADRMQRFADQWERAQVGYWADAMNAIDKGNAGGATIFIGKADVLKHLLKQLAGLGVHPTPDSEKGEDFDVRSHADTV